MNNYKRSKIFGKKEKFNFFIIVCLVIGVISAIYLTMKLSTSENTLADNKSENTIVQNSMKSDKELNVNENVMDNAIQVKDSLNDSSIVSDNVIDNNLKNSTDDSKLANNVEKSDINIDNKVNNNSIDKNVSEKEVAKNEQEVAKQDDLNETAAVSSNKSISFIAPVDGSLIRGYTTDTIFSKTLNSWRTREGIDFKAENGANVVAALGGVVEKIDNDLTERGEYIVINHDGGFKTMYTNLDDEVKVVSGQKVKQGEVIAKVGNTSGNYSNEDYGTHLNFVMYLNNEQVDPTEYMSLK